MTLDRRATDPLTVTDDEPEPKRAVRQRRILAAVSTGAVLYGAHVTVWAIPMLLGAVAGALLFLVWQPQDRLERLRKAWR